MKEEKGTELMIKLELKGEHVKNIINVLAKLPYEQSFEMIHEITSQANKQAPLTVENK